MRVLVVDDHEMVRRSIEVLLRRSGMEVAGTAATVAEARHLLEVRRPDVLLLDIGLPGESGLGLVEELTEAGEGPPVLLYTGQMDVATVRLALNSGALGVLSKTAPTRTMVAAIREVAESRPFVDPSMLALLGSDGGRDPRTRITPREREILEMLARGVPPDGIAEELGVSELTVKTHIRNAMGKLTARTRAHAISLALRRGEIRAD